MAPAQNLGSPIKFPLQRSDTILPKSLCTLTPMQKETVKHDFIKYGSPYDQIDRLFVGLSHTWRGIDAIEFKNGSPVGYISHYKFNENEIPIDRLPQISHPRLLSVREIFVLKGNVYFCYEQWGITLDEIEQLWPVFQLNEAEVALICKAVLEGIRYLHRDLDVCYGGLTGESVLITKGGDVKITGLGETILKSPKNSVFNRSKDAHAVCNIARKLLRHDESTKVRGALGLLAEDFAGVSSTVTTESLLQHPFLQTNAVSWCLGPIHTLCMIARDKKQEMEAA